MIYMKIGLRQSETKLFSPCTNFTVIIPVIYMYVVYTLSHTVIVVDRSYGKLSQNLQRTLRYNYLKNTRRLRRF